MARRPFWTDNQPMARKRAPASEPGPHIVGPVELRFEIKAYTPRTMPLERLARYLSNLAIILGEAKSVHLVRIEAGSTVPVLAVDWESLPKVRKRAHEIRSDEGSSEARAARRAIERDLAEDNAPFGDLLDHQGARLLRFPGVQAVAELEYGPFSQPGTGRAMVRELKCGSEEAVDYPLPRSPPISS